MLLNASYKCSALNSLVTEWCKTFLHGYTVCVCLSKEKLPKKLSGINPSWSISHYLFLIGEADTVTHPEQVTHPSQDTHSHTHTWHSLTPRGHLNLGMFLERQREHENWENTLGEYANCTQKGHGPSRCSAVSLSAASFQIAWFSKATSPHGLVLYQLPWEESEPGASKPFLAHTQNVDWHQRRGFVHGFCQIHLKPSVFFKSPQPRAHTRSLDLIHIKTVNKKISPTSTTWMFLRAVNKLKTAILSREASAKLFYIWSDPKLFQGQMNAVHTGGLSIISFPFNQSVCVYLFYPPWEKELIIELPESDFHWYSRQNKEHKHGWTKVQIFAIIVLLQYKLGSLNS